MVSSIIKTLIPSTAFYQHNIFHGIPTPDPEWKFAVFLRNPAERLLSAYLDKVNGTKRDKDHFLLLYNRTETPTFEEFVKTISQNRVDFDLHSKTQEKLHGVDWRKCSLCVLLCLNTHSNLNTLLFHICAHRSY